MHPGLYLFKNNVSHKISKCCLQGIAVTVSNTVMTEPRPVKSLKTGRHVSTAQSCTSTRRNLGSSAKDAQNGLMLAALGSLNTTNILSVNGVTATDVDAGDQTLAISVAMHEFHL